MRRKPALARRLRCLPRRALAWRRRGASRNDIVPDTWQGDALRPKPDMRGVEKLRFVTDSDYPPFHYFDEVGALTEFNVDLAKAMCEAIEVECEVKDADWSELFASLDNGEADAAIASIRISSDSLLRADFSSRYYATPARFIAQKTNELKEISPEIRSRGIKVGVAKGTGHEAYLKQFFLGIALASFDTPEDAQKALKSGAIDFVFGDGIGLTFWLNGMTSEGCCEFRGGPYLDDEILRRGRRHRGEEGQSATRGNSQLCARAGACERTLRGTVPALLPDELLLGQSGYFSCVGWE